MTDPALRSTVTEERRCGFGPDQSLTEAGPTVEEECPVQKNARESRHVSHDEAAGWPLDPNVVGGAARKEELVFIRKLQVYHEVLVSYLNKSGLKTIGTRWVYTKKGDAANPFIRARLVGSERVDTRRCEQHVCGHAATGESQVHAPSMHDWQPEGAR